MKVNQLQPSFVEFVPETLDEGIIYVSMEYRTTAHLCCCGCRSPIYLPLAPTQWKLTFDGEAISLTPSIGSWSLPCRSHYWIRGNRIQWAEQWSQSRIELGREHDRKLREQGFTDKSRPRHDGECSPEQPKPEVMQRESTLPAQGEAGGLWARLARWICRS